MNYAIVDGNGEVINRIVADEAFMRANFPGRWRVEPDTTGGDTDAPPVTVVVPESVPMLNAHLILIRDGKMPTLQTLVASLPEQDRLEVEAYLNMAINCRRDNKWVQQLGPALGFDSAGLDQFFIAAAALNP